MNTTTTVTICYSYFVFVLNTVSIFKFLHLNENVSHQSLLQLQLWGGYISGKKTFEACLNTKLIIDGPKNNTRGVDIRHRSQLIDILVYSLDQKLDKLYVDHSYSYASF